VTCPHQYTGAPQLQEATLRSSLVAARKDTPVPPARQYSFIWGRKRIHEDKSRTRLRARSQSTSRKSAKTMATRVMPDVSSTRPASFSRIGARSMKGSEVLKQGQSCGHLPTGAPDRRNGTPAVGNPHRQETKNAAIPAKPASSNHRFCPVSRERHHSTAMATSTSRTTSSARERCWKRTSTWPEQPGSRTLDILTTIGSVAETTLRSRCR